MSAMAIIGTTSLADPGTLPGAITVTVSPDPSYKARVGTGSITSDTISASVTGGTGPYVWAVTYVSGDSYTINSPALSATTFTTNLAGGIYKVGNYRFAVTDSLSATANAVAEVALEATGIL